MRIVSEDPLTFELFSLSKMDSMVPNIAGNIWLKAEYEIKRTIRIIVKVLKRFVIIRKDKAVTNSVAIGVLIPLMNIQIDSPIRIKYMSQFDILFLNTDMYIIIKDIYSPKVIG